MRWLAAMGVSVALGCAAQTSTAPHLARPGTDGREHDLAAMAHASRALVVTFFSPSCGCQAAHDARLRALAAIYGPRGVAFVAVDAEADATTGRDAKAVKDRGYAFPILTDPSGELATVLGAEVATHTVVFDAQGRVRYRGGIDSDWTELTDHAEPWLAQAIDGVLESDGAGVIEKRALGCSLRLK